MKCPHCDYEHGWSNSKLEVIEGAFGEFFKGIKLERKHDYHSDEVIYVIGCPSCMKVFIDNY